MATPLENPPLEENDPPVTKARAGAGAADGDSANRDGHKNKVGSRRGIETLFRNVYGVHTNLTTLADSKANFLISVNSLVILVVVVHGINYVDHNVLFIPIAVVLLACVGSAVFAVLSARPRIVKKHPMHDSEPTGGFNLLFFGHFTRLSQERFMSEFDKVLRDRPSIYSHMTQDLYEIGQVLNRKYRLLRCAYGFLLYGLPAGTILFLVLRIMVMTGKL